MKDFQAFVLSYAIADLLFAQVISDYLIPCFPRLSFVETAENLKDATCTRSSTSSRKPNRCRFLSRERSVTLFSFSLLLSSSPEITLHIHLTNFLKNLKTLVI